MRRTLIRLLGIALAAAALITYISWNNDRDEDHFDPAAQLRCTTGTRIAGAQATTAPTTRETRTPEQLATAWATARSLTAGQKRLFAGTGRVDIGLDRGAKTVAVLTFRADEHLGWHLVEVVACQAVPPARSAAPSAS